MNRLVWTLIPLLGLLPHAPASAYEAASTHAGMAEQAAIHGHLLHRWLQRVHGAQLGIYEPIRLDLSRVPETQRAPLAAHLAALDPALGYRPDPRGNNRALGWLAAGAVLEEMPFSRGRHHFLDPRTGHGLRNAANHRGLSLRLRSLDFLEGDGTLGGVFTGANFNLTGMSVLRWMRDRDNALSLPQHLRHRLLALVSASPAVRAHHLALALMTAGALLHLLQDMAVPAHVRNDFVASYLRRRSNILLDRVSAYEDLVRKRYGRAGIPRVTGAVPHHLRLDAFFTNAKATGLADRTQRHFYSLGSLPRTRTLSPGTPLAALLRTVNRSQPYPWPRVRHLLLRHARRGGIYDATANNPHRFAYRVTRRGRLEFTLDSVCYRSTAERLVPEAVRFSAGLLAFLLRGEVALATTGSEIVARLRRGPALAKGKIELLWQDARGFRHRLVRRPVGRIAVGGLLLRVPRSSVPRGARQVIVALSGEDVSSEPIVLGARLPLPGSR